MLSTSRASSIAILTTIFLTLLLYSVSFDLPAFAYTTQVMELVLHKSFRVDTLGMLDPTCKETFQEAPDWYISEMEPVVMLDTFGRLGNRLKSIVKMIGHAEEACCDVVLPQDIVDKWVGKQTKFKMKD